MQAMIMTDMRYNFFCYKSMNYNYLERTSGICGMWNLLSI